MAASKEDKAMYNEAIKVPKEKMLQLEKVNKEILLKARKMPNVAPYYNLELVMNYIECVMLNINMSDASVQYLKTRNSAFLDSARKQFYRVIQLLEEIVGSEVDRSLNENKDYLIKISRINIRQILTIARKISFVFDTLVDKFGDNNKWKWSFVDLYARVANVIKNMINFTEIEKYRNFRSEYFQDREDLLILCKNSLEEAAKELRNKYEMSTKVPGDIQNAIGLLTSLRSINSLYAESEEAERIRTIIDALKDRVNAEEKKKEEEEKEKDKKTKTIKK